MHSGRYIALSIILSFLVLALIPDEIDAQEGAIKKYQRLAPKKKNASDEIDPADLAAKEDQTEPKRLSVEYTLDAYYSSVDLLFHFVKEPVPFARNKTEYKVYRDLILDSFLPRYLLVEASVNPMPVAGVAVRHYYNDFYNDAAIGGEGFNLVRSATLGFEEPYAISLFLGNVVRFYPIAETLEEKATNKVSGYKSNLGYVGYLFSMGNYHIKNNMLIDDLWYEAEWKLKGDQNFTLRKLFWSFRVGAKIHRNSEISNVVYLGIRRSRLDFTASSWALLVNSGFEYKIDFAAKTMIPVRQYFELNKKWPLGKVVAFVLAIGFAWESKNLYSGSLSPYNGRDDYQLILRPNIEF